MVLSPERLSLSSILSTLLAKLIEGKTWVFRFVMRLFYLNSQTQKLSWQDKGWALLAVLSHESAQYDQMSLLWNLDAPQGFFSNFFKFSHIYSDFSLFLELVYSWHTSTSVAVFLLTMLLWKAKETKCVHNFLRGESSSAQVSVWTYMQDYRLIQAGKGGHWCLKTKGNGESHQVASWAFEHPCCIALLCPRPCYRAGTHKSIPRTAVLTAPVPRGPMPNAEFALRCLDLFILIFLTQA